LIRAAPRDDSRSCGDGRYSSRMFPVQGVVFLYYAPQHEIKEEACVQSGRTDGIDD